MRGKPIIAVRVAATAVSDTVTYKGDCFVVRGDPGLHCTEEIP